MRLPAGSSHAARALRFIGDFFQKINDDNVANGAAALGFYLTLAIFPAIILLMSVIP